MKLKSEIKTPPFFNPQKPSKTNLGIQAYAALTTYLKKTDKEQLEARLNELKDDQDFYVSLAEKINQGDWKLLFKECDSHLFPLQALRCLKDGLITSMTFSTSQLFYTVLTHEENSKETGRPMEFIEVLNSNQKRSSRADKMIDATMKIVSSAALLKMKVGVELHLKKMGSGSGSDKDMANFNEKIDTLKKEFGDTLYWTPTQKKQFYLNLLKYPASERSFLLVCDSLIEDVTRGHLSVMDAININIGFNALSRLTINDSPMRIIPSRGMMQAYLEAISPETTPKPMYRLGLSTPPGLHNTLKENGRDLFQSFKFLSHLTPAIVNTHPASPRYVEAELHDFYHQMRVSHIPSIDRALLIRFADKLLDVAKSKTPRNKFASVFAANLIDMEHSYYDVFYVGRERYQKKINELLHGNMEIIFHGMPNLETIENPNQRFWFSLNLCIEKTGISALLKYDDNDIADTHKCLIEWMLSDEFSLNPGIQSILDELPSSKSINHFSKQLQDRMNTDVLKEIEEPCIHHWMKVHNGLTSNTLRERMLHLFTIGKMNQGAEEFLNITIDECYRFHDLYQDKYPKAKTLLQLILVKQIIEKFASHLSSGLFTTVEEKHNKAFVWLMQSINPYSKEYDALIGLAIKNNQFFLFDALYHKTAVNVVFQSDKTTMLHRALAEENIELMMRLTNDGAKPMDIKTYLNPNDEAYFKTHPRVCPFERSLLHGRNELVALLYFSAKTEIGGGIGWMERHPEMVTRFRRLSKEDNVWIDDFYSKIPLGIYITKSTTKLANEINKAGELEQHFKNRIREGGFKLEPNDAPTLFRLRKWREKGGAISEIEIPQYNLGS